MCICKQYTLFKIVNYSAFDNSEYTGAAGLNKTCTLKIENQEYYNQSHTSSFELQAETHIQTHIPAGRAISVQPLNCL